MSKNAQKMLTIVKNGPQAFKGELPRALLRRTGRGAYAGTGVYVVDNEYRIAYFNEVLEHFYPDLQLGSPCYRELCGRTAPCPGCPLGATLGDKTLFFNRLIQTWVEVEAADIEWPGLGA